MDNNQDNQNRGYDAGYGAHGRRPGRPQNRPKTVYRAGMGTVPPPRETAGVPPAGGEAGAPGDAAGYAPPQPAVGAAPPARKAVAPPPMQGSGPATGAAADYQRPAANQQAGGSPAQSPAAPPRPPLPRRESVTADGTPAQRDAAPAQRDAARTEKLAVPVPGVDYVPREFEPYRPKRKRWPVVVAFILVIALGAGLGMGVALWMRGELPWQGAPAAGSGSVASSVAGGPASGSDASATGSLPDGGDGTLAGWIGALQARSYAAIPLPGEMRAMWFAFLEWRARDFASVAAFRTAIGADFATCADMGLNTVIVQVRPFGDALYISELYPWSHVMGGAQGQDPGFDPLAVMIEEAHSRGLRLEAWVNPYRVLHPGNGPAALSGDNPAALHPEWVRTLNGEQWYDPGLPEVEELVVKGVAEIVLGYDVDGIHFDDYFYPSGADDSFDDATWAQYGAGAPRSDWRMANVSRMVQLCYAATKAANPAASFGVSVQGNNTANYTQMYADVNLWMAQAGYIDYVMPQIYWGFGHVDAAGKTIAAFDNKVTEWAGYERHESVALYAGLAAYRIGLLQADGTRADFGGNGTGDNSEWASGHEMADQVAHLRGGTGFAGFALFRYDYMVQPGDDISASEISALKNLLGA